MAKCNGRNGSYECQYEFSGEPHKGMHYAYYVSNGLAYIAEWVDQFGQVKSRKAPAPTRLQR